MPGTVAPTPEEEKPVVRVMAYSNGTLLEKTVENIEELRDITDRHLVTWIDVDGLGDVEVLQRLGEMFGLHALALEDVVNRHQRPKVEDYGDHLFIVARMIHVGDGLQTEQICFFMGKNFVISFQGGIPGDCLDPVRERIRRNNSRLRHGGTDYLTYTLLDSVVDHYFPVVESYGECLDDMDDELANTDGAVPIHAVQAVRSDLMVLRKAVRPHRDALHELLRDGHELLGDETRVYLRDCYDHTIQLSDAIDSYREVCSHLRDFHMAAIGNRTNEAMRTLTIIATIFIPLSFICGLYGMNFQYMPELNWRYSYPVVLGGMGLIGTGLLAWFRKKGWLGP